MKHLTITLALTHNEQNIHPHQALKERWSSFLSRLPMLGYTVEGDEWVEEQAETPAEALAEALAEMSYRELQAEVKTRGLTPDGRSTEDLREALGG